MSGLVPWGTPFQFTRTNGTNLGPHQPYLTELQATQPGILEVALFLNLPQQVPICMCILHGSSSSSAYLYPWHWLRPKLTVYARFNIHFALKVLCCCREIHHQGAMKSVHYFSCQVIRDWKINKVRKGCLMDLVRVPIAWVAMWNSKGFNGTQVVAMLMPWLWGQNICKKSPFQKLTWDAHKCVRFNFGPILCYHDSLPKIV